MTAEEMVARFEREYQQYHRISAERRVEQSRLITAFADSLGGRALTEADAGDFQGFLGDLAETGLHVNTIRKKANMLRPFFSWSYAVGLIDAERFMRLKEVRNPNGSTNKPIPRPYSRAELDAFWSQLDSSLPLLPDKGRGSQALSRWIVGKGPWKRVARHAKRLQIEAIVALCLHCGLRRSEVFQLLPDDLHYDNEYIVVKAKRDSSVDKAREVYYSDAAREAVQAWLDFRLLMRPTCKETWLTCYGPADYNNPMRFKRFRELLAKEVGLGWTYHRFRHTFATERLRSGTPLEIVSAALGHSSLEQTKGYAEIVKRDVAKSLSTTELEFTRRVQRAAA